MGPLLVFLYSSPPHQKKPQKAPLGFFLFFTNFLEKMKTFFKNWGKKGEIFFLGGKSPGKPWAILKTHFFVPTKPQGWVPPPVFKRPPPLFFFFVGNPVLGPRKKT